jgi:hypothetical protein
MEKLIRILLLVSIVVTLTKSVPLQNSKLISSIEEIQRRYSSSVDNESSLKNKDASSTKAMKNDNDVDDTNEDNEIGNESEMGLPFVRNAFGNFNMRQHKMFPFYSQLYALPTVAFPSPFYYPPEFYDDFDSYFNGYGDEEDIMSRTTTGQRRRPQYKNSPIYYIRLPPTPYMFVPGLGYVSQPPTYNPLPAPLPPPPQMPVSPFYNLPINFLANGKPTNIYNWPSPAAPSQFGYPYQQQAAPMRPHRPFRRPMNTVNPMNSMNPYLQDSKVTNLKGPFLFNGRPEEIFLLQNSYNSIYPDPRFANPYY